MDFTREPLVETVITPKDGFKLLIRSISAGSQEEHSVVAVEVVSFGRCYFFRSLEKPQAFLLPMTKYEVVEVREVRTILKKASPEKSIKIGGTKKTEPLKEESAVEGEKKPEKRRLRKKHLKEEAEKSIRKKPIFVKKVTEENTPLPKLSLLPPPTSLISDQINRYKHYLLQKEDTLSQKEEGLDEEKSDVHFIEEREEAVQDKERFLEETSGKGLDENVPASSKEVP